MAIDVTCPSCLTRFKVSEKYAGKQGPCPKCKEILRVPKVEEVKIHAPQEFAAGGKDAKGRPVLKPIEREKLVVSPVKIGIVAGVALVLVIASWALGSVIRSSIAITAVGLMIVSPLIVWAGYQMLRDREFEPFRGRELLVRVGICGTAFALGWYGLYILPENLTENLYSWMFIAVPFILLGAIAGLASFDFSPDNAFFLFAFYVVCTMALRWAAGFPPIWATTAGA